MRTTPTRAILPSGNQPADHWDSKFAGLVLRTYASGHRAWFVRTRTREGKRTRIKLGDHPHIGTAEARRLAVAQIAAVQQGRDPVTERRAARQARRTAAAALTVGVALDRWQEARSTKCDRPWSPRYARAVASAVSVHVPAALRKVPLREVTRETWTRTITKVTRTKPGAAAFLYTSISSFLAYAEAMGWIEQHPLPRQGRGLIAPHVPARTRVLEDHEWLALWTAAEREPPKLRAFTRLLLLTACRVSEVADIAADEVTEDMAMWIIPAVRTKNRREHLVPLCDLARRELHLVWPGDAGPARDERWMLLGRLKGSGFSGTGKLLARLQVASGTAHWTWHDLRRTARTTMTYLGVQEADAEAALNHVSGRSKLVGIYDRSGPPPAALAALRAWQGYVADVVAGRRDPGDAETRYRAALPEELRARPKPVFTPRPKAKPGRRIRDQNNGGIALPDSGKVEVRDEAARVLLGEEEGG